MRRRKDPEVPADAARSPMTFPQGLLWMLLVLVLPGIGQAQGRVEAARDVLAGGRPVQAVELLREAIETEPTADAYLYLGIALANSAEYDEALEILADGSARYPDDARFLNETAGVHLANRDVDLAVSALERAREVDPSDGYAADLLASIRLSEGDVRESLAIWNSVDQPRIDRVLQNFAPGIVDRTVTSALAFSPGDTLQYADWATTEARLFRTELYSNVGVELEPSASEGERFNVIVRTSARRNTRNDILFDLVRGVYNETTYFDFQDIGHTGISWRSSYRWDKDRRRLRGQVFIPLPLPGLPVVELIDTWRKERWNIERPLQGHLASDALFEYKVNTIGFNVEVIPHYRFSLNAGVEYRNRDVTGTIGALGMDARNSGTFRLGVAIRPVDQRYQNQVRLEGFLARDSVLGDFDFNGGTASLLNRFILREASQTYLDFSATGGRVRGEVPIDHYFILGLGSITDYELRAHPANDAGRYGQSPMGTDFVLFNADIEHRVATVPLFNTLGIPYFHIKFMGFFDVAKTFDRNRFFRQDQWFRDTGVGVKFETPTNAFTILYGRDLTGQENSFYAHVEPNLWR